MSDLPPPGGAVNTQHPRYPWEEWFGPGVGHRFVLYKGTHYVCQPHGMVQCLRNASGSNRWRLKLSVRVDADGTIWVDIVGKLPKQKRRWRKKPR